MEAPSPMRKPLLVALKVLISVSLLYWLISRADLPTIWQTIKSANWSLLMLAFASFYVGYLCTARRWQIIMGVIKVPAKFWDLFLTFSVATFFNNFLPSTVGGDAYRMIESYRMGARKGQAVAVIFIDRILGLSALLIIAFLASLVVPKVATQIPFLWLFMIAAFAGLAMLAWFVFGHGRHTLIGWFSGQNPVSRAIHKILNKLDAGIGLFRGRHDVLRQAIFLSLILQVVVVIHYLLIARALHIDISLAALFIITPLANLLMVAPISINGIGLREAIFVFLMGIYGVSEEHALAFSICAFVMILGQGVIGGLVFMFRKKRHPATLADGESFSAGN